MPLPVMAGMSAVMVSRRWPGVEAPAGLSLRFRTPGLRFRTPSHASTVAPAKTRIYSMAQIVDATLDLRRRDSSHPWAKNLRPNRTEIGRSTTRGGQIAGALAPLGTV